MASSAAAFRGGGLQAAIPSIFQAELSPEDAAAAASAAAGARGRPKPGAALAERKPPRTASVAGGLRGVGSVAGTSIAGIETVASVAQLPPSLSPAPSQYSLQVMGQGAMGGAGCI